VDDAGVHEVLLEGLQVLLTKIRRVLLLGRGDGVVTSQIIHSKLRPLP